MIICFLHHLIFQKISWAQILFVSWSSNSEGSAIALYTLLEMQILFKSIFIPSSVTPCNASSRSRSLYQIRYPSIALLHHNIAAASTAPAALNALLFVNRTSTGYIHSIHFAQPKNRLEKVHSIVSESYSLQYANFLPKYFPA